MKPFQAYRNVVVLTGAGISAESGLKTFRDDGGLWEGHRVEEVATPEAFRQDADKVLRFYNQRRTQLVSQALPNAAHTALAAFEQAFTGNYLLVTQNVDDLHDRAGSQNLIHLHGELLKARCESCQCVHEWRDDLGQGSACPVCGLAGAMRPHIVWFGEMPFQMDTINRALVACDLFVSIGTSGNVYPAAGFVQLANDAGADTVELNLEASQGSHLFNRSLQGAACDLVPRLFGV